MQKQDSYNRGGLIAFIFSMAFSLIFFAYIGLLHPGVNLKEVPEEALTSDGGVAQTPAFDMTKVEKPWEQNAEVETYGATIFKRNCASCHGEAGLGDGAAAASLNPPPRNLVEGQWKQGGSSKALYVTLQNGIPGSSMVGFKSISKADRWAMVQYIRSITKNKTPDDATELNAFAPTAD